MDSYAPHNAADILKFTQVCSATCAHRHATTGGTHTTAARAENAAPTVRVKYSSAKHASGERRHEQSRQHRSKGATQPTTQSARAWAKDAIGQRGHADLRSPVTSVIRTRALHQ